MLLTLLLLVHTSPYDPLQIDVGDVATQAFTIKDAKRSREIPILVYFPKGAKPAPVILFSHGLGGSRNASPYLGEHWAKRGYVAVFLQHPGSDESVWKDVPRLKRLAAMREAGNLQNLLLCFGDVPAVLDQLELWNQDVKHPLKGRIDLEHVGMSGHSFGARTTQGVSGQLPSFGKPYSDPRIDAAIVMSPSVPKGTDAEKSFSKVSIPWLLMTGTNDVALIGGADMASRLAVYPALPKGDKYQLILDKAEHSAFTESAMAGDKQKRNPNHHQAILALSTAFWDAYLRDNAEAKAWLQSKEARSVLEKADKWDWK